MAPEEEPTPDIDDVVARLRARVESRRAAGDYPLELEQEMSAHFQRILHLRREPRPLPDLRRPLEMAAEALPLRADRIPIDSELPGGQALHKLVARLVSRQTQGALQQVQTFAQPVYEALELLALAVEELERAIRVDVGQSLDALYERQSFQERELLRASEAGNETSGPL